MVHAKLGKTKNRGNLAENRFQNAVKCPPGIGNSSSARTERFFANQSLPNPLMDIGSKMDFYYLYPWTDMIALALFAIFENGHYSAEQIYYYDSNSKKLANLFARARHKVFIFHRDHKNENFVFYFQMPYYYFKEQSPKKSK